MAENLNNLTIPDDSGGRSSSELKNHSQQVRPELTEVFFRDLEEQLIARILAADFVVGAVAWLTSEPILKALAKVKHGVSLVVQKEDFLRPDLAQQKGRSSTRLRALYAALPEPPERGCWPSVVGSLSVCTDGTMGAVRCVGNHNSERAPAFPRMHNKFLVFCDIDRHVSELRQYPDEESGAMILPRAVWTGSFNFTKNATLSFENAVYMVGNDVSCAYFNEVSQILALSEPLDWTSTWCEPEWRIGT